MYILLIGPPGAGKGTQAHLIQSKCDIPHVSSGALLRDIATEETPFALEIKETLKAGRLLDDTHMINIIKNRLKKADAQKGFLLDGFPRNVNQAKLLQENNVHFDYIIVLKMSDQTILDRLTGRRTHPASGRIYHITNNPPKTTNKDDITGEPLVMREDDKPDTIKQRLADYYKLTEPLIEWYKSQGSSKIIILDADNPIDLVGKMILGYLMDAH